MLNHTHGTPHRPDNVDWGQIGRPRQDSEIALARFVFVIVAHARGDPQLLGQGIGTLYEARPEIRRLPELAFTARITQGPKSGEWTGQCFEKVSKDNGIARCQFGCLVIYARQIGEWPVAGRGQANFLRQLVIGLALIGAVENLQGRVVDIEYFA